jgi:hypothetical protein
MGDGPLEQARSESQLGAIRRDHKRAKVVVDNGGKARKTKDTPHLGEGADLVANVHEHSIRIGHIEACICKRQLIDGRREELDVFDRTLGRRSLGLPDLLGVGVDPDHATGSDRRGKIEGDASDTAADVEDVHARAHVREEEREKTARVAVRDVSLLHSLLDHVALIDA